MGENEWRWKDGYVFSNAFELGDMMDAMKPKEVMYLQSFDERPVKRAKIQRCHDGWYRISMSRGSIRFKSFFVEDEHTIILRCGSFKESGVFYSYAWELVRKGPNEKGWVYEGEGD